LDLLFIKALVPLNLGYIVDKNSFIVTIDQDRLLGIKPGDNTNQLYGLMVGIGTIILIVSPIGLTNSLELTAPYRLTLKVSKVRYFISHNLCLGIRARKS